MEKCSCWEPMYNYIVENENCNIKTFAICNGTKEREECSCNGDPAKCDFYPEKRKENKYMNTAEMWAKAQEDGKTYKCYDMLYNKQFGFHDKAKTKWWPDAFDTIDEILALDKWEIKPENVMTKSEAEAKFNIKIVGD